MNGRSAPPPAQGSILAAPISAPAASIPTPAAPVSAPDASILAPALVPEIPVPVSSHAASASAPTTPTSVPALGSMFSHAPAAPKPGPGPVSMPQTIGELFDQLPHPSHDDHVLPPFTYTEDENGGWPSVPWRKFWLWELREIEFRHELISLDLTLRQAHPDLERLQRIAPELRFYSCKLSWGGHDFAPGCDNWGENDLCSADLRKRLRGLGQFTLFMSYMGPKGEAFMNGVLICSSAINLDAFEEKPSNWIPTYDEKLGFHIILPVFPGDANKLPASAGEQSEMNSTVTARDSGSDKKQDQTETYEVQQDAFLPQVEAPWTSDEYETPVVTGPVRMVVRVRKED
ncbi:hypothetical protein AURDEDRAFT_176825 [Auricularia subglabra TFB-10046 SS5]|uniref:Uncharacterized protein n=1 Tax=Auricularia subglabra (strain TFB-10046 / SS5) TaxID=717982 RepID=J0WQF7_AURST|nr:hypothetical protein AURDEDRAFT_176825 [Auricularia subglabra TFB-10046 SS5]